jgi:hypothetical protein
MTKNKTPHNSTLANMAADVRTEAVVQQIDFCAVRQFIVPKPPHRQSANRYRQPLTTAETTLQQKHTGMKTSIIYLLLSGISLTGFGQAYQPFPTANAMWRENKTGFQCSCCSDYQITITGDTVINLTTYHKLQKTGIKYQEDLIGNCTSNIQSFINQYVGCFRNDSINKRVYFVPPFSLSDTLLYDFNLSLGDTVKSYLSGFTGEDWVVTDVDSVYLGNQYHKRFKLNNCLPKTLFIIEGIGSTFGLLSPFICWAPYWEHIYDLLCFTNNNSTVYPDSTTSCIVVTSVNESAIEKSINIFPNPTSDFINITTTFQLLDISIFNSTGKLVMKEVISSNLIDISRLQPGLYLIQISLDEKQVYRQKILRQ